MYIWFSRVGYATDREKGYVWKQVIELLLIRATSEFNTIAEGDKIASYRYRSLLFSLEGKSEKQQALVQVPYPAGLLLYTIELAPGFIGRTTFGLLPKCKHGIFTDP